MDWQETTALLTVAATAAVFVWRRLRPRKFSFERDTHCGCSVPGADSAHRSILLHARKGEQPRIIVKAN
jgi:hypothetical protein